MPAATAEHCGRANRLSTASSEPAGVCGSALGPELCLVVCGGGDLGRLGFTLMKND